MPRSEPSSTRSNAEPGYQGARNRAFFTILAETGCRVNALRTLEGQDCVEMPTGRLRIFLHEKGKAEPREIEVSREASGAVHAYMAAFNRHAALRRWSVRVQLGEPVPSGATPLAGAGPSATFGRRYAPAGDGPGADADPARLPTSVRDRRDQRPAASHRGPGRRLARARAPR